jgi:hypothetical protein
MSVNRGDGAPRPQVEADHDQAQRDVGEREAGAAPGDHVGDLDGERGDGQHRGEHRHAEDDVVGVEAVRVEAVALPRDVDRQEERGEAGEPGEVVVDDELVGELGYRDDEDEVEEQLQPARVALALLAGDGAQARGAQPGPAVDGLAAQCGHAAMMPSAARRKRRGAGPRGRRRCASRSPAPRVP